MTTSNFAASHEFGAKVAVAPPSTERVEDCRDYLRTGRCKYGVSCKYNHPSNVQSGGGMKIPIDPSEPMFPVRPNEPICQYYIKHGLCKFGQACKFNHPPQHSPMQSNTYGSSNSLYNVINNNNSGGGSSGGTPGRKSVETAPVLINHVAVNQNGAPVMVQFLPQRPEEPDCIYFLKNGRCKYGASCKYHHPVTYHARKREEQQRRIAARTQHEAIATSKQPYLNTYNGQGSHVMLPESNGNGSNKGMTFVTYDNASGPTVHQYQVVATEDGTISYAVPMMGGVPTDQTSSTSSLASSYDTTNELYVSDHVTRWNRSRANHSGGSLNAYTMDASGHASVPMHRPNTMMAISQSTSEGNLAASRRHRTASYGSAGDHPAYYDASGASVNRGSPWRGSEQVVYERRVMPHGSGIPSRDDTRARLSTSTRRGPRTRGSSREGDEGFTMMTSALLNMLDTPEEASAESFSDDENRYIHSYPGDTHIDRAMFERLSIHGATASNYEMRQSHGLMDSHHHHHQDDWSPTWRSSSYQDNNVPVINPSRSLLPPGHHGHPPPSPGPDSHHSSDVGLYLS